MINQEKIKNMIDERFYWGGFVCSETTLSILHELGYTGGMTPEVIKMMTVFGGGVANHKSLCGAVTGACCAIGACFGRSVPEGERWVSFDMADTFVNRFEEKFGSITCGDLITEAQDKGIEFKSQEIYDYCKKYVEYAVIEAITMIEEKRAENEE